MCLKKVLILTNINILTDDVCSESSLSCESIKGEDLATTVPIEHSLSGKDTSNVYCGAEGQMLSTHHLAAITYFSRKQQKGFIDVWWLYDDGG